MNDGFPLQYWLPDGMWENSGKYGSRKGEFPKACLLCQVKLALTRYAS